MPLPDRLRRLSARSVYSRHAPKKEKTEIIAKKLRGRPSKHPIKKNVKVLKKAKERVLSKKRKTLAGTKRGKSQVEDNSSSEADCSSLENSSEDDQSEASSTEEVSNVKNKTQRKNKSLKNKKKEEEEDSEEEEEQNTSAKGKPSKKRIIKKEEVEDEEEEGDDDDEEEEEEEDDESDGDNEDDEENEEDEEDTDDEVDEEEEMQSKEGDTDENVLYSLPDKKTTPEKKKRKLMNGTIPENKKIPSVNKIEIKEEEELFDSSCPSPSKQKKVELNKSIQTTIKSEKDNDESNSSQISSNEVDMEDDTSSHDSPMANVNQLSAYLNDQKTKNQEKVLANSNSNAKFSLQEIMDNSISKSKISSYVENNRTAKCGNSAAQEAFQWMISPVNPQVFFDVIHNKKPFHIPRKNPHYYQGLFSCNDLENMIKENNLVYEGHIDVVKYENCEKVPTSINGKAIISNIWDDFKDGYSVRVRNPQTYNKNLWNLCSLLQEYFSSAVGVNIYLTPPNSQGFPPHYDDIDALIVQTGGSKKWKIYAPRNKNENLARYPSKDFHPDEIGEPLMEIVVKTGDFLYIPRGYIHQAEALEDDYSLHLTFSTNQLNTWGDFMLQALNHAMDHAILNETDLRKSLPKDYTDYIGTANLKMNFSSERSDFIKEFRRLAKLSLTYLSADEAADSHSLRFLYTGLPPVLNKVEKAHSIHGNGSHWKNGKVKQVRYPKLNSSIQLLRRRNIRLIVEDGIGKVYHTFDNERDPQPLPDLGSDNKPPFVELSLEEVPAFVYLLRHSPNFVPVHTLPLNKKSEKLSFVRTLYESGLLMTEEPLEFVKEDQSSSVNPGFFTM